MIWAFLVETFHLDFLASGIYYSVCQAVGICHWVSLVDIQYYVCQVYILLVAAQDYSLY